MGSRALEEFVAEVEDLLERLSQDLAQLGESVDGGQPNPDLVNGIFRDAHSIKGLAGMFGFHELAELAHHLESLLDHLRLGKIPLDHPLIDCLFDSLEGLSGLLKGKVANQDFTPDISPYLVRIEHLLGTTVAPREDWFEGLNIDPSLLGVLTEYEEHRLQVNRQDGKKLLLINVAFPLTSFDTKLAAISDGIKKCGELISTLPGLPQENPELISFRLFCATGLTVTELCKQLAVDGLDVEIVDAGLEAPESELKPDPEPPPEPPVAAEAPVIQNPEPTATGESSARSVASSVRVDIGKLDYLMTIVGELVLAKGTITQICRDLQPQGGSHVQELEKAVHLLGRRLNDLQSGVMDVRLVPVRQLFDRMNRIVRRMAFELGKKVVLELRGGDTELDKLIVEELTDPLMHIIRNAIDHGIEPHPERKRLGKPEVGTITLSAAQEGNHVVLEIRDDGHGIDSEQLRRKGIEKGLIAADAVKNRQELFGLLFQPGFSTREEVSEYSGRGVGMDVVKNNIAALSGLIEMDSEVGKGTVISLTLPITLAIIKALVVKVRGREYAIPLNAVMESLLLEPGMLNTIEGREVMELRDQTLSLLRIDEHFALSGSTATDSAFVVVAGFADKRIGLVVDELCGQQDVVIKSLGKALSFVKGIAGAADLGNQKTVLVLDVGGLIGANLQLEGRVWV